MKKMITVLLFLAMCMVLFVACKKDTKKQTTQDVVNTGTSYTFGYCAIDKSNPYFISLEEYLTEEAQRMGHKMIVKDAKSDIHLQKEQIAELIDLKVDAIFLAPVDWSEITPELIKIREAGIKIINVDTKVQEFDLVDAYIGSDNYQAGALCGEDLIARLPGGGKIIIVECPNRNSINDRIQSFEKTIAQKGFEIVARIDSQAKLEYTVEQVENVLKEQPDVVAIMCGNDQSAIGALIAANVRVPNQIIIYGIDGSPDVKKEIVKGNSKIVATVAQSTEQIATTSLQIAYKILSGEDYEKVTYIDTVLIDAENISEYEINKWQ